MSLALVWSLLTAAGGLLTEAVRWEVGLLGTTGWVGRRRLEPKEAGAGADATG